MDPTIKSFIVKYSGWTFCVALICYFIFQSPQAGGNDFSNSYFGAHFLLKGEFDLGIFDPYTFNKKIYDEGYRNLFLNYNPNPPSTAIFFVPFAFPPLNTSKILFNILTSCFFLISTYRLCKHLGVDENLTLLCIPLVFFIPIRNQILFGQTYFLIFTLLAEGFIAYEKKNLTLAAVLWGASICIKVFPAILILFLVLKKDWKQIIFLGGSCLIIFMISVAFQGIEVWKEYLLVVLPRNNQGEINAAYLTTYQSALMLFKYLFVLDETSNPKPFIDSLILFKISLILFKAVVLAACTIVIIHRKDILSFGLVLLCGILISPFGSTYSNVLLLILLIALQKEYKSSVVFWVAAGLIFLIGNIPTNMFEHLPMALRFPRLILMCSLFVFIFWISRANVDLKIFAFYIVLLGVPALFSTNKSEDPSKRLLPGNLHNLIFDYGIRNGIFFYSYWYDGPETFLTNFNAISLKRAGIDIRDNQIFYRGSQMTNSPDNKIRASIVNDNAIIYLSDKGRGIGFYTLRVIPLP